MEISRACPAVELANRIGELEVWLDRADHLFAGMFQAGSMLPAGLREPAELFQERLVAEAEAARERLAAIEASSLAGAVAQLRTAIRDIRVADGPELRRASVLAGRAIAFLEAASSGGLDSERVLGSPIPPLGLVSSTIDSPTIIDDEFEIPAFLRPAAGNGD